MSRATDYSMIAARYDKTRIRFEIPPDEYLSRAAGPVVAVDVRGLYVPPLGSAETVLGG